MSVIPQLYNQGTGLLGSTTEGSTLPDEVDDLIVENSLLVLGTTTLEGPTVINDDLTVNGTVTTQSLIVQNPIVVDEVDVQNANVADTATIGKTITGEIGENSNALFSLPLVTGTDGQVLAILDDSATPPTTEWKDDANIINYVSYNVADEALINNLPGSQTEIVNLNIDEINVDDGNIEKAIIKEIGDDAATTFKLPASNGTNGQVLAILDDSAAPPTTEWKDDANVTDYVTYDDTTKEFTNNVSGVSTVVSDISISDQLIADTVSTLRVGQQNNEFILPNNTQTSQVGDVLKILNIVGGQRTASWQEDEAISDYVKYDNVSDKFSYVENSIETEIETIQLLDNILIGKINPAVAGEYITAGNQSGQADGFLEIQRQDVLGGGTYNVNFTMNNEFEYVSQPTSNQFTRSEFSITPQLSTITLSQQSTSFINTLFFGQSGITLESSESIVMNPGGGYIRLPQGTPQSGQCMRFTDPLQGDGSLATPYIMEYAL